MKKLLSFLILFTIGCNFAFSEVIYYEDFTYYGELITDIAVSESDREQKIQVAYPSFLNKKIPVILSGKAHVNRIKGKSMICLELDKLSIDARKSMPVKIMVTAVNGKQINQACCPNQNWYIAGLKKANKLSKDVIFYPINSYKYMPKAIKPTSNNFIMLLEPFYFMGGALIFALSPITAPFYVKNFTDIPRGSIIEFQFLEEINREQLEKVVNEEYM